MKDAFTVLFEDNHLLVVNKAAGILVQGDETGDKPLSDFAKQYIKEKYGKPGEVFLGVVHRLDRPVTGVVVLARTSKALERMNRLFREKETTKTYWAVVTSKPPREEGVLVHWLVKDERKNRTTAYNNEASGGLKSELRYKLIATAEPYFLLQVNPVTGRSHQIRVQLASMGCVIKGDLKYGDTEPNEDASICLHAKRLEFVHPVRNERLTIEAPVPDVFPWTRLRYFD